MPDRRKPPRLSKMGPIELPPYRIHQLHNGIRLYEVRMGTQDVFKLEVVFRAGRYYEHKKLVARATVRQLKEGTQHRSAADIANTIDYYGGSLSAPFNLDYAGLSLHGLSRHFGHLLPVLADCIIQPTFPEKELGQFIREQQQKLRVDLTQADVLAYRKFTEALYGSEHPYGYNSTPEMYGLLTTNDLRLHYERHFTGGNCAIFLSGNTSDEQIALINELLAAKIPSGFSSTYDPPETPFEERYLELPMPNKSQVAVRMGRRLFPRSDEDYFGLFILNTVLGGYFGSRLMTNIREDKGYAYNIYSSVESLCRSGYLMIGTEAGSEHTQAVIQEIHKELRRLRSELIGREELTMVKNYLYGYLTAALDGPFNVADVVKTMVMEDLSPDYFKRLVASIKTISAERLRDLARIYLDESDFHTVIAGKIG